MKIENSDKSQVTPLRRAGQVGLAILNPFSDVVVIYRKGVQPFLGKLKVLSGLLGRRSSPGEALDWAQAVECSGRTVAQLETTYTRIRAGWWLLMAIAGSLSLILLFMVLLANVSLPVTTFMRAAVWILILAALGSVGFLKTLEATYRLWQLRTRRVSNVERGTFQDFKTETRWCLQVMTLGHLGS